MVTVHSITNIPEDVWQWARRQGGRMGPASFLRDLIVSTAMQSMNGDGGNRAKAHTTTTQPKAKQALIEVLEGRKIYAHGCRAILQANDWDYIDTAQLMQKPPEDVLDFLQSCSFEVGMYADMFPSRRNLLKMIFDAYMRSHRDRED